MFFHPASRYPATKRQQKTAIQQIVKPKSPITVKKEPEKLPKEKCLITAPISGRIIVIKVVVGSHIRKGQSIFILEAMKMENVITAPITGVIKEIKISNGTVVSKGEVLAVIT